MLPIHAVLEPLKTVLSQGNTAVLAAPAVGRNWAVSAR